MDGMELKRKIKIAAPRQSSRMCPVLNINLRTYKSVEERVGLS